MAYQDEKGHFTTKENDGGPCHHGSGNGAKKKKYDSRGKSLSDFDKENPGEGSHNNIINALRNSSYDSVDAAMKDAEKYNLTDDQKEYVHEYAKHVFGEEFDDDYEEEFTGREPGGVKGDLERAGFEKINVVDDKTLTFEGPDTKTWTIKENENAGFDVYDGTGKKVLDDVNAVRENIATKILQREQNPMKDFDIDDFNVEDARPHETRLHDLNLTDSEIWNMAYKYIGNDKLEQLAEKLDLDSPQDLRTSDMIKYMSDDDIADMLNYNGYDEEEDWEDDEYDRDSSIQEGLDYIKNNYSEQEFGDIHSFAEKRMKDWPGDERAEILQKFKEGKTENDKFKKQLDEAGYQLKQNEYGVEKKPSKGIPHKPVDMPKYHKEGGHIVIDEGPHKGESYDTEEDYYNSVRSEKAAPAYKSKYEPEDFEDARFYPTKSTMEGSRWVGRYRSMKDAHGLKDWNDDRLKHVEDYNNTSIFQLPDGYYSINPNITSMSFKTVDALKDYLDRKNPEEHKYGVYWDGDIQRDYRLKDENGKEYGAEGPDAYKAARKPKEQKLNYSPEMKKVKNAIKGLTLDSKEERRKLLLQMLDEIDNEE